MYAIALEWPENFLELNISEPPENTKVTLLGRKGNIPWEYKNGKMKIDVRDVKFNKMSSCYAWTFKLKNYNQK